MLRSRWFAGLAACAYAAVLVLSEVIRTDLCSVLVYASCVMFLTGMTGRDLPASSRAGLWLTLICSFGLASAISGIALMTLNYLGLYHPDSPGSYTFYVALLGLFVSLTFWRLQERKAARKNGQAVPHTNKRREHGPDNEGVLQAAPSRRTGHHQAQVFGP